MIFYRRILYSFYILIYNQTEEDEETRAYRLKIEKQKAMREKILRDKEMRRRKAAEDIKIKDEVYLVELCIRR